jgi:hypothetical protein
MAVESPQRPTVLKRESKLRHQLPVGGQLEQVHSDAFNQCSVGYPFKFYPVTVPLSVGDSERAQLTVGEYKMPLGEHAVLIQIEEGGGDNLLSQAVHFQMLYEIFGQ